MRRSNPALVRSAAQVIALEALDGRRLMAATAGLADGSLGNHGFTSTGQSGAVIKQLVQNDGKIVALVSTGRSYSVERIDASTGKLDTSFGTKGIAVTADWVNDIALAPDGKVVTTTVLQQNGTEINRVSRYTTAGKLDTGFAGKGSLDFRVLTAGKNGTPADEYEVPWRVQVDASGRPIVAVVATDASENEPGLQLMLTRLTAAGKIDTTYNGNGHVTVFGDITKYTDDVTSFEIAKGTDGSILTAAGGHTLHVDRVGSDGKIKTTANVDSSKPFGGDAAENSVVVNTLAVTPTNQVLYGGYVDIKTHGFAGGRVAVVGRLNAADLKPDTMLNGVGIEDLPYKGDIVRGVAAEQDGKILVASGVHASSNDTYKSSLSVARLTANGSLDAGFGNGGVAPVQLSFDDTESGSLTLTNDDRILIGAASTGQTAAFEHLTNDLYVGTVTGSTGTSGHDRAKAFDGSLDTFFDAASTSGNTVGLDLGTQRKVTQIRFAPRSGYGSRMAGGVFQASNDASFKTGVVTLYTIGKAAVAEGKLTTVNVTNTGSYRYVRYVSPAGSHGDVAEVQLVGTVGTPDAKGQFVIDPTVVRPMTSTVAITANTFADNAADLKDLLK